KIRNKEKALKAKADIERAKTEERERVRKKSSADFHDEAGHLITKITLFLELAKRNASGNVKVGEYLQRIEENTKLLSSGMRDFIWGMDPEKDSLYDTLIRLKDFGNYLFQHSDMHFQAEGINFSLKQISLAMDARRSILFIFKEAMNNCLKYSRCNYIVLQAGLEGNILTIALIDDGIGFEKTPYGQGYGLKNMRTRAKKNNANLYIISKPGQGTKILFELNITQMGD
ncbi:MAG: sensor histidine kinase, partial [Calditrichia bacterium]